MSESPLHFKTVRELGDLVRSRQVSPVELAAPADGSRGW